MGDRGAREDRRPQTICCSFSASYEVDSVRDGIIGRIIRYGGLEGTESMQKQSQVMWVEDNGGRAAIPAEREQRVKLKVRVQAPHLFRVAPTPRGSSLNSHFWSPRALGAECDPTIRSIGWKNGVVGTARRRFETAMLPRGQDEVNPTISGRSLLFRVITSWEIDPTFCRLCNGRKLWRLIVVLRDRDRTRYRSLFTKSNYLTRSIWWIESGQQPASHRSMIQFG